MIPKKLHYCWFGGNEKPDIFNRCLDSWRRLLPDWEIIEWNESNFNVNECDYTKYHHNMGNQALVSDYVRYYVLYRHGGFYVDIDVELTNSLDDLLDYDGVYTWESSDLDYIGCALIGSKSGNIIMDIAIRNLTRNFYQSIVIDDLDYSAPEALRDTLYPYIRFTTSTSTIEFDNSIILGVDEFVVSDSVEKDVKYGVHYNTRTWKTGMKHHEVFINDNYLAKIRDVVILLQGNYTKPILSSVIATDYKYGDYVSYTLLETAKQTLTITIDKDKNPDRVYMNKTDNHTGILTEGVQINNDIALIVDVNSHTYSVLYLS